MLVRQRHLDVDGGENGENEGLKGADEYLERDKHDAKSEGAKTEQSHRVALGKHAEEEEVGGEKAEREQHVPGDHVHRESQRQRDWPNDEGRKELEDDDDGLDGPRHAGQHHCVLEEPHAVPVDSRVDEGYVRDNGENDRLTDEPGARNLKPRDRSGQVHCERQEEDRHEDRHETLALFLTERVDHDALSHELDDDF